MQFKAILGLWVYDIIKIVVIHDALVSYGVNPWMFFILDVVTVPPYIIGFGHLFSTLLGKIQRWGTIFKWGTITFAASAIPYLYLAWASHQDFPESVRVMLAFILVFPFVNLIRKIRVEKRKKTGFKSDPA